MSRQRHTPKIYERIAKSFAQLNSRDSCLPQLEEIKGDVHQWPQSCFSMVMRCFLITWLMAASWGTSIALMLSGKPYGVPLGAFGFSVMSSLSFWPVRIIKNSLHLLFLNTCTDISKNLNDAQANRFTNLADTSADVLAPPTDKRQQVIEYPGDCATPNLTPVSANQHNKANDDNDDAKQRQYK